jgi:hypothetical protein
LISAASARASTSTSRGSDAQTIGVAVSACDDDWREDNARADWDIRMARDPMIEFVGGEPAAQLREQSLSA